MNSFFQNLRIHISYRRTQIKSGFIEEATGFAPSDIAYQNDVKKENLIPLEFDGVIEPKKHPKDYPEYEFFKARK